LTSNRFLARAWRAYEKALQHGATGEQAMGAALRTIAKELIAEAIARPIDNRGKHQAEVLRQVAEILVTLAVTDREKEKADG
jgi:hypothetical protein